MNTYVLLHCERKSDITVNVPLHLKHKNDVIINCQTSQSYAKLLE